MADSQRINELIELLGVGDNPSHDRNITLELTNIGKEAVPPLIEALLHHPNAKVRSDAASILGSIKGEEVVEPLIAALNDSDGRTRMFAVTSLGLIGDRRAIEPLLWVLREDKTSFVAEALAQFGDKKFIEPIIESLYANAEKVLQWAKDDDDEDMYKFPKRSDFFSRSHIRALTTFDDPRVIPPLVEAISSQDIKVFDPAFYGLKEIGADAVEPLMADFRQDGTDRQRIVWLLGEIGDLRAFDLIVEALHDPDNLVQSNSILALGDLKDPRAIPPLLEYLSHLPPEEKWAITTTKKVLEELGYTNENNTQ